ncbi:MAG: SH3 domain-containing protein [Chloroflexota bacterium]
MNPLNENTLLILVGLVLLLINVIIGAVRLRQGHLRAGVFNVLLALAACILIAFGLVRISFAPLFGSPVAAAAAVQTKPGTAVNVANGANGADPSQGKASDNSATDPDVIALRKGTVSAPMMAELANGTIPAPMQTVMASRPEGSNGNVAPQNVSNPSSPAAVTGVPNAGAVAINRMAPLATAVAALVIIVASFALYLAERRRQEFNPSTSAGLLNTGAGIFTLVAALVLPIIPLQLSGARLPIGTVAQAQTIAGTTTPKPIVVDTATPTGTATPSTTPTAVPSLTPAPSETPIVLVTAIAYVSTDTTTVNTSCSVTANTMLNLRGDPSISQRAIGKVFAGSLLPVTGQSADNKWLRVVNTMITTDQSIEVEGWVSVEFVTANASCATANVPVITATSTPSATPR